MHVNNIVTYGNVTDYNLYQNLLDNLNIITQSQDHLKDNYQLDRLDLSNHLSYDVLLDKNSHPVCFSGIYHRPYWPAGAYRISNRTFVVNTHRTSHYSFLNPRYIGPIQIATHKSSINLAFISRENPKGKYYFRKLKRSVDFYSDWTISDRMIKLVDDYKKSSYQYVIYKQYGDTSIDTFESVAESEWNELPH